MQRNDTITCAITPGAGRVMPSTASVFRAVDKGDFAAENAGCNQRNAGCWAADSCKERSSYGWNGNCGTAFGRNRNNDCGRNQGCNDGCNCGDNNGTTFGRNRNNDCGRNQGCNDSCNCGDNNGTTFGRNNDCGCNQGCNDGCNGNNNRSGHNKGRTPAMVYEEEHQLCKLHEAEEAIRKGTLFSELYMPMNGECADACGAQLCDGQAEAFAAWELRLYLNTHPCDQQALKLFRQLARKTCQPNYATTFAEDCDDRWSWTDAPWPWEFNCGCE